MECCQKFRPEKWDNKKFNWKNKEFIKESMPTLFHIPFPPMIGKKLTKMWNLATESKKAPKKEDVLILFADPSPFKSEMFLTVTGPVPNADNVKLSGTFKSRVFDGPYNAIPKYIAEFEKELDKKPKNYYVHYAYCPKCAKKFGHNYMILFAEL